MQTPKCTINWDTATVQMPKCNAIWAPQPCRRQNAMQFGHRSRADAKMQCNLGTAVVQMPKCNAIWAL